MSTHSTIPNVKDALVSMLTGDPGMQGVQVSWGFPPNIEREALIIGGADIAEDWTAIGARTREENYTIQCFLNVMIPGGDQREVTKRVYEIYDIVSDLMRDNPNLGMAGTVLWASLAPLKLTEQPNPDGRESELHFGIKVKARF